MDAVSMLTAVAGLTASPVAPTGCARGAARMTGPPCCLPAWLAWVRRTHSRVSTWTAGPAFGVYHLGQLARQCKAAERAICSEKQGEGVRGRIAQHEATAARR